jgi:hypothetical protein
MDQQLAQIDVAALADAQQPRPAAGRDLFGHQPQPCRQVAGPPERVTAADRGRQCGRVQDTDARDRRQQPSRLAAAGAKPPAAESASQARTHKNGRRVNLRGIADSNRGRSRPTAPGWPQRSGTTSGPGAEVVSDHGLSESELSRDDDNRLKQVRALITAWDGALPAARRDFVTWLREHYPDWVGAAAGGRGGGAAIPRRRDRPGLDQPLAGAAREPVLALGLGSHSKTRTSSVLVSILPRCMAWLP